MMQAEPDDVQILSRSREMSEATDPKRGNKYTTADFARCEPDIDRAQRISSSRSGSTTVAGTNGYSLCKQAKAAVFFLFTLLPVCCIVKLMNAHPRQAVEQGFERDRLDYWAMRDELLAKYPGKWVAVHKGRVMAVGDDPLSIMEQALGEDGYAYSNKVGDEDKIVVRQRRVSFPYDDTYSPTPIR